MTNRLAQIISIFASLVSISAAEQPAATPPPKVLVVTREFLKPARSGAAHEKAERLYVEAFNRAKSPIRYIGMDALSGKSRALFFSGYPSLAAWREAQSAERNDPELLASMARANLADGDVLESIDRSVWLFDDDHSFQPAFDFAGARYFEIELFQVRPGHNEWLELSKLLKAAYAKAMPDRHYALYANLYGLPESSFLVITPLKSAAEIDDAIAASPKFMDAVGGEAGMKHLFDLESAAVASSEMNLFTVNPRISRPPDSWLQSDPAFWNPKPKEPPAPKP